MACKVIFIGFNNILLGGPPRGGVLILGSLVFLYFGFYDVIYCVDTVIASWCGDALMVV